MGTRRKLFGPSKQEIWRQLTTEIGARWVDGGFRLTVYRNGVLSDLARRLGMQDVEVGDEPFDRDFIIKGTDEAELRALFTNPRIRNLIAGQTEIHFTVRDDEGWFGPGFPGRR